MRNLSKKIQSKPNEYVKRKIERKSSAKSSQNPLGLDLKVEDSEFSYTQLPFNVQIFKNIVSKNRVESIINLLNSKVADHIEAINEPGFRNFKYILDVKGINPLKYPSSAVKLTLKHGLVSIKKNKIVFIVKDLPPPSDSEATIKYYHNFLRTQSLKEITILPFSKLRKLYNSLQYKEHLSKLYEFFLCDSSILTHVTGYLGAPFEKQRCTLYPVRTNALDNFISDIKKSLKQTSYRPLRNGSISIPIGIREHSQGKVAENLMHVVKKLRTLYPGSYENIRNMYIRINVGHRLSLPIYIGIASISNNNKGKTAIKKSNRNFINFDEFAKQCNIESTSNNSHKDSDQNNKSKIDEINGVPICKNFSSMKLKQNYKTKKKQSKVSTMIQDILPTSDDDEDVNKLCGDHEDQKTGIMRLITMLILTKIAAYN